MDTNTTSLPPLKAVTPTDQGGVLAIAASMGLVFAIMSLLIRAYVRIECRAAYAKDDFASCSSMVIMIIQTSVVFVAISHGYGRITSDLTAEAIYAWQRDIFVSEIFYIAIMSLTKTSVVLLLLRLSRHPTHTLVSRILLVTVAVYFVISVFVVAIRCDLSGPWVMDSQPSCPNTTFARWSVVTVMDALTEVALFGGSLLLVRDLQLPWSRKSVVVLAYALRLPVIVLAAVRLYYIRESIYSDDLSLHGILASVCTQVELGYAVAAATMPCLKPFMSALNTQYGGGPACIMVNQSIVTAHGRNRNQSGTYSLATHASTAARKSTESEAEFFGHKGSADVSLHHLPKMSGAITTLEKDEKDSDDGRAHLSSSASTAATSHLGARVLAADNVGTAV